MRIGIINMPGRNKHIDQSIQTKFFILGLPLFPTGNMYRISDSLGIDIPLTGKDVLHAYAKIHFGLLGVIALVWGKATLSGSNKTMGMLLLLSGMIMLGISIYSWAVHREAKGDELIHRRIFGKAFLYNMLPEYLPTNIQKKLYNELQKIYFGKYRTPEWQKAITNEEVTKSNFCMLYTLAYYQKTLQPSSENQSLFAEVKAYVGKVKQFKSEASAADATATASTTPNTATSDTAAPNANTPNTGTPNTTIPNNNITYSNTRPNTVAPNNTATNTNAQQEPIKQKAAVTAETETAKLMKAFHELKAPRTVESNIPQEPNLLKIKMTSGDLTKIHDARGKMLGQAGIVGGFMLFACVIMMVIIPDVMVIGFSVLLILAILGFSFLPDYMKLGNDLSNKEKMRIKVRIKDLSEEGGAAYLVLQPNPYNITLLTAPSKYYSTDLLNKELEIYVSKESHTLLDIIGFSY